MGRAYELRKGRRAKRYGALSKTFSRIGKEIAMAIRESGANPESNSKLRALIQNSKALNMPKENIDRAIKKATDKDQADYKEIVYEGYGPYGVAVVVETATDNANRTVASVRSIFTRAGGNLGTSGSLDFLFDRKSSFKIKSEGVDQETLELELLDFEVDEVFEGEEENELVIYGPYAEFNHIQKYLESNNYEIITAHFERIPTDQKELTPEQEAEIEKMLEKFEDDDDVQNVYHNAALNG